MNNDEKIRAIEAWQKNEELHPLTCGNDSNHRALVPDEDENGSVILKCLDCDYTQDNIPEVVFEMIKTYKSADQQLRILMAGETYEDAAKRLYYEVLGHEEAQEAHDRLVREIDVIINGEEGAAKQASLCDLVGQIREMKRALDKENEDESLPSDSDDNSSR